MGTALPLSLAAFLSSLPSGGLIPHELLDFVSKHYRPLTLEEENLVCVFNTVSFLTPYLGSFLFSWRLVYKELYSVRNLFTL